MSHATAAQSQLQPSFWGSVWESLQGSHQDFTVGNLNRAILLLAIPMVLEMALESLFAVVDVFWVSHLGANAVATVGLTESMLTLVFAAALGVKHHQSCARSLPDFWFGPFPASGSDRRSLGNVHGAQHRCYVSVLSPASWQRADSRAAAAHPAELCRSTAAPASLVDWHPAICHRAHELDRPGAHCKHVRFGCTRRVHDCHSHRYLCDPALVGTEQCGSHACGAEPGSEAAGSRRNLGVAHGVL